MLSYANCLLVIALSDKKLHQSSEHFFDKKANQYTVSP